jgi:predicted  nucleic acid-binding Zn-ribbon protein
MIEAPFFGRLVEALSSVILIFSVGAYSFLWYKIRRVEEDVEESRKTLTDMQQTLASVWNRIFGRDEDETMKGHLVETEQRFDDIDNKLEEISQKIDGVESRRQVEHGEVVKRVSRIASALDEEKEIDFSKEDCSED